MNLLPFPFINSDKNLNFTEKKKKKKSDPPFFFSIRPQKFVFQSTKLANSHLSENLTAFSTLLVCIIMRNLKITSKHLTCAWFHRFYSFHKWISGNEPNNWINKRKEYDLSEIFAMPCSIPYVNISQ